MHYKMLFNTTVEKDAEFKTETNPDAYGNDDYQHRRLYGFDIKYKEGIYEIPRVSADHKLFDQLLSHPALIEYQLINGIKP